MRKKYLSALLFGALLFASTGTFTSCKDYDDDISNLQEQITSNKDAIAALQKLVGEGKWVTSISPIENGFTVTMSDGTTTEVKGINGADGAAGKDGTEWSIGEDGYWYMDGEKTDHYALGTKGEDGKDGLTAPAPFINADGYWVVYELDEATGEFVATTTEVPAQGTSAYVVEKDGVYILHIANESGVFQDVTLPASADVFVVDAPASSVNVKFQYAKWNPSTTNKQYEALVKEFPELAEIEKDSLVKQGGNLPLLVNPASVELNDKYTFSLQNVKGETPKITVSNPVKGLPEGTVVSSSGQMTTRSSESDACFWTLSIAPEIEKKQYVQITREAVSLVVENELGKVSKTPFAYSVASESLSGKDVDIQTWGNAKYASEIDLLAAYEDEYGYDEYPVTITYGYNGYHIITLTNDYEVERYGLSIAEDGKTLKIANMPSDASSITVHLNVIALGLNGSTDMKDVTLTISQEIAAAGALADQNITFDGKDQKLTWKIADLGLSAVELDKVLGGYVNMTATREYYDNRDQEVKAIAYNGAVTFYNEKGSVTRYTSDGTWSNGAAVTFGITINATSMSVPSATFDYPTAERWVAPTEYTITLTSTDGATIIYSAEATLTTALPEVTDSFIRLAAGYVENGVLQITGDVSGNNVSYNLRDAFVLNGVNIIDFEDLDYDKEETDATSTAYYNWTPNGQYLTVNTWKTKNEVGSSWSAAQWNQLYTTRNLRANIYFFNNSDNKATFDFEATVKSTIYSEEPTSVITIDGTKLVSNYGGDAIKVKEAISKAVYAAGTQKDQEYSLFQVVGKDDKKDVTDYESPKVDNSGKYVISSSSLPVEIDRADLTKLGMSVETYIGLGANDKFYLTTETQKYVVSDNSTPNDPDDDIIEHIMGWSDIMAVIKKIYHYNNGTWELKDKDAQLNAEQALCKELFEKYSTKIAFNTKEVDIKIESADRGAGLAGDPTLEFADKNEAAKYVNTNTLSSFEIKPLAENELTVDPKEVKIPMYLVVKDNWGMTMKVPFDLTIKTTK